MSLQITLELPPAAYERIVQEARAHNQTLVEWITATALQRLKEEAPAPISTAPQSLYGIWKDRVPSDLDIDAVLHEIRSEWSAEWQENSDV